MVNVPDGIKVSGIDFLGGLEVACLYSWRVARQQGMIGKERNEGNCYEWCVQLTVRVAFGRGADHQPEVVNTGQDRLLAIVLACSFFLWPRQHWPFPANWY